jgi:hypothetical protein
MTYAELIETVQRRSGFVELSHTSPIFSITLKLASQTGSDDVGPLLLESLVRACQDLGAAYRELTEMKMRTMEPVIIKRGDR